MGRDWPRIVLVLTLILALSLLLNLYQLFSRPSDAEIVESFHQLAYDSQETRDQASAAGSTAYLCKPIDFEELKKMIDQLLNEVPG